MNVPLASEKKQKAETLERWFDTDQLLSEMIITCLTKSLHSNTPEQAEGWHDQAAQLRLIRENLKKQSQAKL